MDLIGALAYLTIDRPVEGRLSQGRWLTYAVSEDGTQGRWLTYTVSEDGTQILREGEPVRLEDLLELDWRLPPKSPETWVEEAKALLEMGASMVDADTLRGVLDRVSELEAQLKTG